MLIGALFALAAMVLNSIAGMLQADATTHTRPHHPLAAQPRYLGGLVVDGLGWVCTVIALRLMPVFAVQAILGGAIAVTALASRWLWGIRLRGLDRVGVGACLAGLVLVAAAAGPQGAMVDTVADVTLIGAAVLLSAVLVAMRNVRAAWAFATVAGLGFGATSLAVRAVRLPGGSDLVDLLRQPAVYVVVAFWLIGMISYSRALGRGELSVVTAVFTITEVVVPGLVGMLVLHDQVRPGWGWVVVAGLVFATSGVLELALSPTQHPAARSTAERR